MADAYLKVKDNGAQGLALVREETDTSVSELEAQFEDAIGEPDFVIDATDLSEYTQHNGNLSVSQSSYGKWNNVNDNNKHIYIPLSRNVGGTVSVKANANTNTVIAFVKDYVTPISGEQPIYSDATGYDNAISITSGRSKKYDIPSDCHGVILMVRINSSDKTPSEFNLVIPGEEGSLTARVSENEEGLLSDSTLKNESWQFGSVNLSSGTINSSYTTSIVTTGWVDIAKGAKFLTDNSHLFRVYGWDANGYQGVWTGLEYTADGSAASYGFSEISIQSLLDAGTIKVRIVLLRTDETAITINDGNSLIYRANGIWNNENSIKSIQASINTVKSPYNHGPFMINRADYATWYEGLQEEYTGFGRNTTYAEVIAAFDALMDAHKGYITRHTEEEWTISGVDFLGETYSHTIYEYVFAPKQHTNKLLVGKTPRIYMDGSIHGFEKSSTYGLYYFMKDICENWDKNPSLKNLRSCVEFHIIPVVNPWGFDNYMYVNENRVNINRNFDSKYWVSYMNPAPYDPENKTADFDNTGLDAFDQPETRIIRDWLLAGRDNMLMYFNGHTDSTVVEDVTHMNACIVRDDGDEYFNKLIKVFCDHINKQTVAIPETYSEIQEIIQDDEMIGHIMLRKDPKSLTDTEKRGTASSWAAAFAHILAMTLETFNGIWLDSTKQSTEVLALYSSDALKINSEIIGNLVLQVLAEYAAH